MSSIFNNDYAKEWFRDNGYPYQCYNDGMLAWLRDVYVTTGSTLPDLLARYLKDYGDDFNMIIAGKSAVSISLVEPAATFTAVTPSSASGGADTLLTSAGVHGLTSAVSVGANIYISAGTGWTVGLHKITAIAVDTTGTTIQIDTPYDAGMGTPTISLVNTEAVFASIVIPPLLPNSFIRISISTSHSDTTATSKVIRVKLGSTSFSSVTVTSQPNNSKVFWIANRGSTSSQINNFPLNASIGQGNTAAAYTTGTEDTSIASTLTIVSLPGAENIVAKLESYFIEVFK